MVLSGAKLFGSAYFGGAGKGTISKLTVAPTVTNLHVAANNLIFNGINGLAGHPYTVLANTNPTLPYDQWAPLVTNVFSNGGNFSITATNGVNPAAQQFYLLQTPAQ